MLMHLVSYELVEEMCSLYQTIGQNHDNKIRLPISRVCFGAGAVKGYSVQSVS